MIILSPSILAADFTELGRQIKEVDEAGCEYLHFDVMDGMFVPNISFGLPVLSSIKKATKRVMDVHLMIKEPERYIERFAKAGGNIITIHLEASSDVEKTLKCIHSYGLKAGLSIKPDTDVSLLKDYYGLCDMFLIMTVEPGFGGQSYMDKCTAKIKELRDDLTRCGYNTNIEVDGGITKDNVRTVLDAGANVIVMGSSIFKGNIRSNVNDFKAIFKEYD